MLIFICFVFKSILTKVIKSIINIKNKKFIHITYITASRFIAPTLNRHSFNI